MRVITPQTLLPVGTKVSVGNFRGEVIESKMSVDQFNQPICKHKIKLIERAVSQMLGRTIWKKLKTPFERYVNYSFIYANQS